ncbi:ABC transporter ATP-binding protein [Microbacterium soli]|uniref:ATP-binding cassette domain-containing protein n=1 Tax=Microbacterium soli TaxID=446075 RepID=A0ABP7MXT9_9MICO
MSDQRTPEQVSFRELRLTDVSKWFGSGHRAFQALKEVNLTIVPGSSIGIVGESGSGKSTMSRIVMGLESASSGTVTLDGEDTRLRLAKPASARRFRRTVQYIGQDTSSTFDPRRSLRDSVTIPAMLLTGASRSSANEQADELFQSFGIDPTLADRRPHQVSGGQRQRFAIARALIVRPQILLCDEIVSALDVSVQGAILNLLRDYCRQTGAAMTFVSHGLPATAFISQQLVVMKEGEIVERGTTAEVLEHPQHPYTRQLVGAYEYTRRSSG